MIGNATRRYRTGPWLALALLFGAAPAAAGVVTTLADSGPGSLRDQVSAGGAVTFSPGLTGTITLTSGAIVVNGANTPSITGPGADRITVGAGGASRIFSVTGSTSVSGLTLTAGNAGAAGQGGAIFSTGSLTLDGVAITSSTASDAGGAVYSTGTLTIASSLLSGNSVTAVTCAGGGAIRSEGVGSALAIRNSTITANSAPSCNGGGVSFNDGTASITASTITANSAGLGGGNVYKGSSAAALTLSTSVISDGSTGGGTPLNPDLHGAFGGGLASSGYNLVKSRGDATGFVASDLADGSDPLLGSLANNGGPTATRLPQPTSPLLERSGAPCQATDQRGFTRPQGVSCDIGAVEYRELPLTATVVGSGSVSAGATPAPTIGSISNCTGTCVAYYDGEVQPTVTLTATPGVNQTFTGWSGACVGGTNPVTTVTMAGARTCIATFVPSTFIVTPSVGSGSGSISPSTPQTVTSGATTSFTLTPAANWHILGVGGTCGGSLVGNTYTTNAVAADCTVVADFAIDTHVVTASVSGGNGSISPAGPIAVDHGSSTSFTLTPAANYHVAGVGGTCGGSLAGNTYTTNAITIDCTVIASFAIDTHTVTPSVSGGNGTISPSTPQSVNHGASTSFTLTPAANHHVASVAGTCGGNLAGNVYTTHAVTADCSVVASFAIDTHTVTPSVSGGNGTVSPSTPQTVDHGATTSFTLTPAANYHVGAVTGTCGGSLAGNVYTTNAVNADCTVVASFAIDTHTVTPSVSGGNGTISPSTPQSVDHGATTSFTLTPAANYHVGTVTGTCGGSLAGNVYTTNAVDADCTVVASFAIDTHTVTPSVSGGNGTISPSTPQTVDHGATTSFTLTPDANYHVGTVTGTCGGSLAGNVYTTNAVDADCTVIASFAIDTHTVTPSVCCGNGTISPSTPQNIDHGATTTFTLTPASSYHIVDVTGTCGGSLAGDVYTTNAITADCTVIANFAIDTHTIGGNVTGLMGSGLVLRLNGANDLPIVANGPFVFAAALDDLSAYAVTVAQQPTGPTQVCTVGNGSGTLAGSDITNVAVDCAPPAPHLTVSVTDNRSYVRYGMLLTYLVRMTNDGEGIATGVSVSNASPPQIDAVSTSWSCHGAGGGAICQASGSGALNDSGVALPPGRTLTWVVTAPVRVDAPTGLIDYTVDVGGPSPASATDRDTIVIFRTGMDVPHGGGAEGATVDESPLACAPAPAEAQQFDLTTTRVFELPRTPAETAVDTVLVAHGDASASFRLERLNVDAKPSVRLVAVGRDGAERASAWAPTQPGASLALAIVTIGDRATLLLEGEQVSLELPLPDGLSPAVVARTSPRACDE
ncbi:MAG TPA: choice-of-anchor Q domain-containing protein [Kofleriaceae bacterium]|nr:choice-of-anchor Q domain-containing protein [Kofleriaceae bacterium]